MIRASLPALGAAALGLSTLALSLLAAPEPAPLSPAPSCAVSCPEPAAGPAAGAAAEAGRPAPAHDLSCKPQGPVDVLLRQAAAAGARVELELAVAPRRDLLRLDWELQTPGDAVLLEGQRAGAASVEARAATTGRVALLVPEDQRFRQARLVVRGAFTGLDETGAAFEEPFEVVKHLSWGEHPDPAPRRLTRDGETGELVEVVALPTAHRMGR